MPLPLKQFARKHLLLISMMTGMSGMLQPALALEADRSAAVIFVYSRIGEDTFPSTSIRKEQFEAHMLELARGGYSVLPLTEIVAAYKSGKNLPPKTVAITFDGAFKSVYMQAAPVLEKHNLPYTLFIAPRVLDNPSPDTMSWQDVKRLTRSGIAAIGLHPASYARIYTGSQSDMRAEINSAIASLRENLDLAPTLFAYPFGEYTKIYRDTIEQMGFQAAFGQQSGVASAYEDIFALPRFSMTESYGDIERFQMAANALPLPVTDATPQDPHVSANPPSIGFTVNADGENLSPLSCFASGQYKPDMEIIGESRVELRPQEPFDQERVRINCTMPTNTSDPENPVRWRWFGMLLTVPNDLLAAYAASALEEEPEPGTEE